MNNHTAKTNSKKELKILCLPKQTNPAILISHLISFLTETVQSLCEVFSEMDIIFVQYCVTMSNCKYPLIYFNISCCVQVQNNALNNSAF